MSDETSEWPLPGMTPLFDDVEFRQLVEERVLTGPDLGDVEQPTAINWNALTADQARAAWADLDAWVSWLRTAFGLTPDLIPPLWHRHDELVWELSALHTHWLACYAEDAPPSAPIGWMREFADARHRLREWVAACGTRLDRDRPTHQTSWPGEPQLGPGAERGITDRAADFAAFVEEDVASRTTPDTAGGDES